MPSRVDFKHEKSNIYTCISRIYYDICKFDLFNLIKPKMSLNSCPNLTVVAISLPEKERNLELLNPNLELLDKFQGKKLYFADCKLTTSEIISFFKDQIRYGCERCGTYEYRTSGRKAYMNIVKKLSGKEFSDLDYTENVRRILRIENNLVSNEGTLSLIEKNYLKASILHAQTFERASKVLRDINLNEECVIYADFSLAYSIHLLSGCEIEYDVHDDFIEYVDQFLDLKESFLFFYKVMGKGLWNERPTYKGKDKDKVDFSLYVYEHKHNGEFHGFVSNTYGLGVVKGIVDQTKSMLNMDWHYIVNGQPQNGFMVYQNKKDSYKIKENIFLE